MNTNLWCDHPRSCTCTYFATFLTNSTNVSPLYLLFFTVSITQLEKTRLSMELCQNAPSFAGESTQPNLCLFPLTLHMFSTKKGKLSWPASWLPRSQRERPQAQGGRVGTWLHESSLIAGVFLPAVRMSTWGNFVDLYFLLKRNNQLLKGIKSKIF